jgi:tetratricopeptide (TPR) repeat protein
MSKPNRQILVCALVLLFGFAAVFELSGYNERNRVMLPQSFEDQDLALQGKRLKGYGLGFEGLLADWYWMQSLQYIGGRISNSDKEVVNLENLRPFHLSLLYPLLDNATDLDPTFMAAYSYGATVLPAVDTDAAIRLTEKGIANNPDHWRFYQYLGYIYWRSKNYEKAAEVYQKGASISGAPGFLGLMAARMSTEGGSRDTAREMYSQMLAEARDQQTKITAERNLVRLDSLDERDAADGALKQFVERHGRCATGWNELIPALSGIKLPNDHQFHLDNQSRLADPTGVPYVLDQKSCRVVLSPDSQIPAF